MIVVYFYDVESGRTELDQRGHKTGYERFDIPIPRAGGIGDLLAEAAYPGRPDKDAGHVKAAYIRETRQRDTERERSQRTLADLARRQNNVMR